MREFQFFESLDEFSGFEKLVFVHDSYQCVGKGEDPVILKTVIVGTCCTQENHAQRYIRSCVVRRATRWLLIFPQELIW